MQSEHLSYWTVYDISQTSPVDVFLLLWSIGAICAGYFAVRFPEKNSNRAMPIWGTRAIGSLFLIVGFFAPILTTARTMLRANDVRNGRGIIVQGKIEDYRSQSDCKRDTFTLDGHSFKFSQFENMSRFHDAAACGGPLHNGMYVRLTFTGDDDILKVEVRKGFAGT